MQACIALRKDDFDAIVIELKAACVALGGNEVECHIPKDLR